MESNASALGIFGVQSFSFGRFLESKALALGVFGVQSFSFGRFWSPTLQLWL
ncbi:hypothetical protein QUF54_05660 [Candidatus Marithioploca araucensis]|uniref:Uncharacterized protein n=1 Tax=Candidatus Marithioploca araucensis TaxID=70273 RepID=A0ABT7VTC6_9GAMM|nr:hypothetical protein [Candidatus Marithioploca araucensis]